MELAFLYHFCELGSIYNFSARVTYDANLRHFVSQKNKKKRKEKGAPNLRIVVLGCAHQHLPDNTFISKEEKTYDRRPILLVPIDDFNPSTTPPQT